VTQILLFSFAITSVTVAFYRYSFPYPQSEYLSLFLLLFSLGFGTNLVNRSWGRVWIVIGSLCFVRIGSWTGILKTIPEWTTLHPLFLGGIWGIVAKEWIQLRSRPAKERILVGYVHYVFLFFLFVLGLERFLEYNPEFVPFREFPEKLDFFPKDSYYYPGLSNRQAFQLTWMILDTMIPPIFYFSLEEIFKRDAENPARDYKIGLWVVFFLQSLVIWIQGFLRPEALMQDTGMSLEVGRVAGLFKDSGSASWIFPTIGILLFLEIYNRKGQMRESLRIFLLVLIYLCILVGGIKLGRAFLLIFGAFSLIGLFRILSNRIPVSDVRLRYLIGIFVFLFVSSLFYSLLWFGEYQNAFLSLKKASTEWKLVQQEISLKRVEARRVGLFLTSRDLFLSSPVFGNGLGSLIVEMKRPNSDLKNKPPDGFVDSPSNFYIGWLADTGILGTIVLGVYVWLNGYIRKSWNRYILLVLPLMTGFQIVHPDGGFFVCFLLLGFVNYERIRWKIAGERPRLFWFILGIGLSLHFFIFALLKNP